MNKLTEKMWEAEQRIRKEHESEKDWHDKIFLAELCHKIELMEEIKKVTELESREIMYLVKFYVVGDERVYFNIGKYLEKGSTESGSRVSKRGEEIILKVAELCRPLMLELEQKNSVIEGFLADVNRAFNRLTNL